MIIKLGKVSEVTKGGSPGQAENFTSTTHQP